MRWEDGEVQEMGGAGHGGWQMWGRPTHADCAGCGDVVVGRCVMGGGLDIEVI